LGEIAPTGAVAGQLRRGAPRHGRGTGSARHGAHGPDRRRRAHVWRRVGTVLAYDGRAEQRKNFEALPQIYLDLNSADIQYGDDAS